MIVIYAAGSRAAASRVVVPENYNARLAELP